MKNYIKAYKIRKRKIILSLEVKDVPLTTDHFPEVRPILRRRLPSVFENKCFNSKNLSFYKESGKTELGHLFEHILLEYMCLTKMPYANAVSFSGRTYWNALKPDGNFRVEIKCNLIDWPVFEIALQKSIALMNSILSAGSQIPGRGQSVSQTAPTLN